MCTGAKLLLLSCGHRGMSNWCVSSCGRLVKIQLLILHNRNFDFLRRHVWPVHLRLFLPLWLAARPSSQNSNEEIQHKEAEIPLLGQVWHSTDCRYRIAAMDNESGRDFLTVLLQVHLPPGNPGRRHSAVSCKQQYANSPWCSLSMEILDPRRGDRAERSVLSSVLQMAVSSWGVLFPV